MRYAFLTTEFTTTRSGGGGLSTYVTRMSRLLAEHGHEVEVFVLDETRGDVVRIDGVLVRHIRHRRSAAARSTDAVLSRIGQAHLPARRYMKAAAKTIAAALDDVHALAPFDVVQSADYLGIGAFVTRAPGRIHVVRCSAAMDLYMACDGNDDKVSAEQTRAELDCIARADVAIAPSAFVARHLSTRLGRTVRTVRPPAFLECEAKAEAPKWLPGRYLLHFAGDLCRRKGTDFLATALAIAVREEPEMVAVCVGKIKPPQLAAVRAAAGEAFGNLLITHQQEKPVLFAMIRQATAVVLPSLVDNLPNTAIESQLLGARIVGTRGTSLDEIASPAIGDLLVDPNDPVELAAAMVRAWRSPASTAKGDWLASPLGAPFRPDFALADHLAAIGLLSDGPDTPLFGAIDNAA